MRIVVFATKPYDRQFLDAANTAHGHEIRYLEPRLDASTAPLATGSDAVCVFVNDQVDRAALERLAELGVRFVALRCAGYNNVDLGAAEALGIDVVRVPEYSPAAVAEFTIGLLLALDRRIHRAWARVRENNFALEGLVGRTLAGRTIGVVGTGRIGAHVARILRRGFGARVLAHDPAEDSELLSQGVEYVSREALIAQADVITLHCPLTPQTHYIIDGAAIAAAREGVLIVNTSRGALIETSALIAGLKSGKIGGVALDVYEQEADLFFEDLSNQVIQDDIFQRLLTFPNVLITGHQAFLTEEALRAIADTTLKSLSDAELGRSLEHRVTLAATRAS